MIGAGLAGLIAALEAAKGSKDVLLVDRGSIGAGTNSALSNGIFAGPTRGYQKSDYVRDVLTSGKGLNQRAFVERVSENALDGIALLRSHGVEMQEFEGFYAVKSPSVDAIRGITLIRGLVSAVSKSRRIERLPRFYVDKIKRRDGMVSGITGIGEDGIRCVVHAGCVVLATGGAGGIYLRNDNQRRTLGQGFHLAAEAGVELWDMEFVQFYPLVLAEPGLPSLLIYPPYPSEGKVVNADGEDLLQKHHMGDPNSAIKGKRDEFSAVLFEEMRYGPVYLDYTNVPPDSWEKRPLSILPHRKHDFRNQPFLVSPAAHFFMGGVGVDETFQTALPGLFACGEILWGLHGANRMRGNALTECVVSGMLAGRAAARQCSMGRRDPTPHQEKEPKAVPVGPLRNTSHWRGLRNELRQLAWNRAGVVRSEEGLAKGLNELPILLSKLQGLSPQNLAEARSSEDFKSAAFVLECILLASRMRRETRGAFRRSDYDRRDDVNCGWNSCITYDIENQKRISVRFTSPSNQA